jgi:hypothetical protein
MRETNPISGWPMAATPPTIPVFHHSTIPISRYAGRPKAIPIASPEMAFLGEKIQDTVLALVVFWYSGLAPLKTRFFGADTVCIWHVARGYLDFWPKNAGGCVPERCGNRRPCSGSSVRRTCLARGAVLHRARRCGTWCPCLWCS